MGAGQRAELVAVVQQPGRQPATGGPVDRLGEQLDRAAAHLDRDNVVLAERAEQGGEGRHQVGVVAARCRASAARRRCAAGQATTAAHLGTLVTDVLQW
ncbi:hypothetical protein [Micromonospora deserti]|uniref:Uncharacterized protein n=1 Tax=Micromonospora deserti TaxID=2070366 RepID=A0A2W2CNS2_9ACTN|nr:hypothetical protein [Micromonospora deserti]PZG01132.1 hypothetical protein C1I99_08230 [Micromonospora deserti]